MLFLQQVTQYIHENFKNLGELAIILPSRRSTFALRAELKLEGLEEGQTPKIYAIEDFIASFSGIKKADQIELLLEIQESFKDLVKSENDNLLSWLPTLLKDFNRIDQNLVDAKQLFSNLSDIQAIARWTRDYATDEPEPSEGIQNYFRFWGNLYDVYKNLRGNLQKIQKGYSGMMYRHLAENAETLLLELPETKHFLFIGLNAITKAEESIILTLLKHKKATLLWDTDDYYMAANTENQAGKFLQKYKNQASRFENFGTGHFLWQTDNLLSTSKQFQFIGCSNGTLQAKVAQELLKAWGKPTENGKTAIVLPDENLLLPLLYSINEDNISISMGLSLQKSTLFNLVDSLFEMQQTKKHFVETVRTTDKDSNGDAVRAKKNIQKYHHKNILKVLNHPFIRKYENMFAEDKNVSFIRDVVTFITRYNKVYLSKFQLSKQIPEKLIESKSEERKDIYKAHYQNFAKLINVLFVDWGSDKALLKAFNSLQKLLAFFEGIYIESNDLEKFYIQKFSGVLKSLRGTLKSRKHEIDVRSFRALLYQLIREERVAFENERNADLQIMGLLETRTLDFEHLIILSANEDTLPAAKKSQSLIPFDIAKAFELPTYQDQDAIIQYHFYRLLQRAKKIALVYVEPVDTYGGKKEKSRFLLQIENDLKLKNPNVEIIHQSVSLDVEKPLENVEELRITKTTEILQKIKENFKKGVSPTSLDTYINCSLQYYFTHVVGIREAEGVEEELGSDKFGVILHEILEEIFREHSTSGKNVGVDDLKLELTFIEKRVKAKFEDKKYAGYSLSGQNYLGYKMIIKNLEDFLNQQIRELSTEIELNNSFKILGLEVRKYNAEPILNPDYVTIQPAEIIIAKDDENVILNIKGIIDRIDYASQTIRIVDYKTGKVEQKQLTVKESDLEALMTSRDFSKARQLWLYRYILEKNILENPDFKEYKDKNLQIMAGIYSMRNLQADGGGFLNLHLPVDINDNFIENAEKNIKGLVLDILDKHKPFEKTTDLNACEWCDFKGICGR